MTESDDERTVHWYYSVDGKEQGPILVSRLRQMARRNEIKPDNLVRKGKAGSWMTAGSVVELTDFDSGSTPVTDVAEEASLDPAEPSQLQYLQQSAWWWFTSASRSAIDRIVLLRTVAGYIALVVIVVSLARVAIKQTGFTWSAPVDPLAQYESLWSELKSNRESHAEKAVWGEFAERGRRELEPVVARLEQEAGVKNRESQLLLWAGRDCLPVMFSDSRTMPSRAEVQLAEYLENVKRLRDGQPIYGRVSGRILPPERLFGDIPAAMLVSVGLTVANFGLILWFISSRAVRKL